MGSYIDVPKNLTIEVLEAEFGKPAVAFYLARIEERRAQGKKYLNPLKTIYLWATEDRRTNQGYYTTYRGYARHRKNRNFGRS